MLNPVLHYLNVLRPNSGILLTKALFDGNVQLLLKNSALPVHFAPLHFTLWRVR